MSKVVEALDPKALEAAARHSYEWEGDRKGIMYVGWSHEPESTREEWRESARQVARAYLSAQAPSDAEPVSHGPGELHTVLEVMQNGITNESPYGTLQLHLNRIRDVLASPYSAAIEDAARALEERRQLLHHQHEMIDIGREDAVYDICIAAIRALTPRTT